MSDESAMPHHDVEESLRSSVRAMASTSSRRARSYVLGPTSFAEMGTLELLELFEQTRAFAFGSAAIANDGATS